MTPWITKPVPFNIGQGAAAAGAAAGCSTYPDSETTNVEGTSDGVAIATSDMLFGDGMCQFDGSDDKIDNANLPPYIRCLLYTSPSPRD